jgi:LPXTG-site transpeptidase (sortase) family protein
VRVVPASGGPFDNTASGSGTSPLGVTVNDFSQDGLNPDPDGNNDPTDNDIPTPVSFSAILFDPPFGIKLVSDSGLPVLAWTMVWINNTNIVAVNAAVEDVVPVGTAYVGGSLTCTGASPATTTTFCSFDPPSVSYPRGRIQWTGVIGPDLGATDAASAVNELYINFNVTVDPGVLGVQNEATIDSDRNGDGDTTDPGEQPVARAAAAWNPLPAGLPNTGFAPGRISKLPPQSQDNLYTSLGSLWLEIPRLGVSTSIVGVPLGSSGWDVSWLGRSAGWLNGTAYPTWTGNSILTGHVYLPNGKPGPFVSINTLGWGDQVIVHMDGQRYIYEVRQVLRVDPDDLSVLKHEERPWLTLLTCRGYDESSNTYKYRLAVRAVLVRVEAETDMTK